MKSMPQEIEVWYLIPALRRELTKIFIEDYDMSQKQVSGILSVTESAVSQYLKSKRAQELKFSEKEVEEIKKTAKLIHEDREHTLEHLYGLCVRLRGCSSLCELHKKHDSNLPKNCDLCC
tara:strand:+ start:474 stop:833 length:360 start_codon:yes stop_codon:yes gene_type:complete